MKTNLAKKSLNLSQLIINDLDPSLKRWAFANAHGRTCRQHSGNGVSSVSTPVGTSHFVILDGTRGYSLPTPATPLVFLSKVSL